MFSIFSRRTGRATIRNSSSVEIRPPRRTIGLGKYQWPLGKAGIRLLRKSTPFWQILGQHHIFSAVLRVPITFPPEKLYGVQLAGMCVPDLRGTQGTFSFYSTRPERGLEQTGGETHRVTRQGTTIQAELVGPANPFRKDASALKRPFTITVKDEVSADLRIEGVAHHLRKGVYSEWIRVAFRAAPGVKVHGVCKFLLLESGPDLQCYVTPIHIDPEKPAMPISYPAVYSTYLSKRQGPFGTLGLAEDTWALNEGVLGDETFIQQCLDLDRERESMFFDCLDKVKRGLCVCVFDGTDRLQHTFWRDTDCAGLARRGRGRANPGPGVGGIVLPHGRPGRPHDGGLQPRSERADDHFRPRIQQFSTRRGSQPLAGSRRLSQGQRSPARGETPGRDRLVADAGLRRRPGRHLSESQGTILARQRRAGAEADALGGEIAAKLAALTDPENRQPAVKRVYQAADVYRGPYTEAAPDLIVGYQRGYRAAWETAIGHVTEEVFHTNHKAWSGDHCVDHSLVPGVLFCNRKIAGEDPRLMDVGPTVLDMFGVTPPLYMDGKPLVLSEA